MRIAIAIEGEHQEKNVSAIERLTGVFAQDLKSLGVIVTATTVEPDMDGLLAPRPVKTKFAGGLKLDKDEPAPVKKRAAKKKAAKKKG